MSTSVYLCDVKRRLAFELGAVSTWEGFPVEATLSVDEALKEVKARYQGTAGELLSLASFLHEFAKAAAFDVDVRVYHELPEGWRYEGGVWNLRDAVTRFSRRLE